MSHGVKRDMPYGPFFCPFPLHVVLIHEYLVRLGKSGLKVSRIILGCMTYGSTDWGEWVLDEKTGLEHIKAAYDAGINAFDTANVNLLQRCDVMKY
jgi:hypothetical protein